MFRYCVKKAAEQNTSQGIVSCTPAWNAARLGHVKCLRVIFEIVETQEDGIDMLEEFHDVRQSLVFTAAANGHVPVLKFLKRKFEEYGYPEGFWKKQKKTSLLEVSMCSENSEEVTAYLLTEPGMPWSMDEVVEIACGCIKSISCVHGILTVLHESIPGVFDQKSCPRVRKVLYYAAIHHSADAVIFFANLFGRSVFFHSISSPHPHSTKLLTKEMCLANALLPGYERVPMAKCSGFSIFPKNLGMRRSLPPSYGRSQVFSSSWSLEVNSPCRESLNFFQNLLLVLVGRVVMEEVTSILSKASHLFFSNWE